MNNRNREQEQRERAQRNRYSASGYGSDESDLGPGQPSQPYASRASGQSSVLGGRQGRDRDIQGDPGGWRQPSQHREGSYPQAGAASPDDSSRRGDYARSGYAGTGSTAYERGTRQQGRSQEYGSYGAGSQASGYGAGSESYDDQDFAQDYSQGSSHFGSQGFGAAGSQGVYGPQGFGSQGGIGMRPSEYGLGAGYSSSGGYGREGYGAGQQYAQGGRSSGSDAWRARDVSGQGYGSSTGYRGMGPKNYTRSDERIREDLNERLTDADDIDASGISVDVSNGVATLTGTVDQRWMKHRAEDLAESCSGVRDVNNQIRVASPSGWTSSDSLHAGTGASSAQGSAAARAGSSSTGGASTPSASSPTTGSSAAGGSSSTGTTNRTGGSTLS